MRLEQRAWHPAQAEAPEWEEAGRARLAALGDLKAADGGLARATNAVRQRCVEGLVGAAAGADDGQVILIDRVAAEKGFLVADDHGCHTSVSTLLS